jgi:hypothetical protein
MVAQTHRRWEVYVGGPRSGRCMAPPNARHAFGLSCGSRSVGRIRKPWRYEGFANAQPFEEPSRWASARKGERGMLRTVALGALFLIALSQPVLAERGAKDEYGNHQRGHVGGGLRFCALQLCDLAAHREPVMLRRLMEKRVAACPRFP